MSEAHIGDRVIVQSRRVGQPAREGEIMEVVPSSSGHDRWRVRWADGRESVVMPGTDVTVASATHERARDDAGPETHVVTIELRVEEDSDHCDATATMRTSLGSFTGSGHARRHPTDPVVPMIGEELAIARSLADLGARLEEAASGAIAARENRSLHLIT